jgi:hypothetical protein
MLVFVHVAEADEEHFERVIRPLLAKHCFECHSGPKQFNGLRLDSRSHAFQGGDSGAAIVPGKPMQSLLFLAISQLGELKMPPDSKLTVEEIEIVRSWIEKGAFWPTNDTPLSVLANPSTARNHWAFQPVSHADTPNPEPDGLASFNAVDAFINRSLNAASLRPTPQADRRTLIRRVTYDLTGLPPSSEEINAFVLDKEPAAYERLIDRLLASPAYGEHLARMWLDVARYADTKGYVYAREERFFVNASAYREWVIRAFQSDIPFDHFLRAQLAADQYSPDDPTQLAAMGFLTLGRRFLGVTHDIIDDRIDVVTRGMMGMTVSCARCHDHKYDPIPTTDYYALYGIFQNCTDRQVSIPTSTADQLNGISQPDYSEGLRQRIEKLNAKLSSERLQVANRTRARIADYLFAQTEISRYPEEGFDVVLSSTDLNPTIVRRFENYLSLARINGNPIFDLWFRLTSLGSNNLNHRIQSVHSEWIESQPQLAFALSFFSDVPNDIREAADQYGRMFRQAEQEIQARRLARAPLSEDLALIDEFLFGPKSPCEVPDEEIVGNEFYFDSGTVVELWKLQGEVDRWRLKYCIQPNIAVALFDRPLPIEPRVFKRGNAAQKGEYVSRRFLSALNVLPNRKYSIGSGRRELAEDITNPRNPLTARVWVNRLWQRYFGVGLVATPSDFGLRSPPPSHPELLDWLASELISRGWNSKSIQRTILTSAAYQRASSSDNLAVDSIATTRQHLEQAWQRDPKNQLLWRYSPKKLTFEELRDTLLLVSGDLDLALVGPTKDMFGTTDSHHRRTVYGLVDRQFLPSTLRHFDFANPDLHIAKRSETSIPQQSLFLLNSPFIAHRARSLVNRLTSSGSLAEPSRLAELVFEEVLGRKPTPLENQSIVDFVRAAARTSSPTNPKSVDWCYGYGELDDKTGQLVAFQLLSHFANGIWQGGSRYPDAKLGWVQLTSKGGHPGNDLKHACVRRWTAPRDMTVSIRSSVKHEPSVGDGIRCRIHHSRSGCLQTELVHGAQVAMNVASFSVKQGDTIDFVVDILKELNSDQFEWAPEIRTVDECWDALRDFSGPESPPLTPWELVAQALMLSNELNFVD